MKELETTIDIIHSDSVATVYTGKRAYISRIYTLKEQYPDLVNIITVNEDGSILVKVPSSWFKFVSPKKKSNLHKTNDDVKDDIS